MSFEAYKASVMICAEKGPVTMKKILKFVYDTWYGASLVLLVAFAIQFVHSILIAHFKYAMPDWSDGLLIGLACLVVFCELSCFAAIIVSFCRRKWKRALVQAGLGVLLFVFSFVASFFTLFCSMFGPSEDYFNDSLTVPAGLKCEEPEPYVDEGRRQKYEDDAVFASAMANPKDYTEAMQKSTAIYKKLLFEKHELALTYFRRNPLWVRDCFSKKERYIRTFWAKGQYCKVELPMTRPYRDVYAARPGCRVPEYGWYASSVALYDELSKVDALEDVSAIDSIIREPKPYVSTERPDFKLVNGFQGGIYHYKATIDPGEDGEVYLKAYEVTKDYQLSATRMKQATLEKVTGKGAHVVGRKFTIYEGDWDHYYAARVEIWFVPSKGGAERKLKEKVFRVQGWMR